MPQVTALKLKIHAITVLSSQSWNSLSASLQQPDIEFGHFKRLLKAFLFGETTAH